MLCIVARMVHSTAPYPIPKNGCRPFPEICVAPTDAKVAYRKPLALAMCRWCDALGPICRYVSDPDFAETTAKGFPYVPPYPDDLLAELDSEDSSVSSSEDEEVQPRARRPKPPTRPKRRVSSGIIPPLPAIRPDLLHWLALAIGTHLTHALCLAGAQSARASDKAWFDPKPGLPNEVEVLFYAILVANIDWTVADLDLWASKVLEEEPHRLELGSDWTPPDNEWWRSSRKAAAASFEPLRVAIQQTEWGKPALDHVGAAMQRWRGAGRCDELTHQELYRQLRKDRPVHGPKPPKGRPRMRFEYAVVEVAALVKRRGAQLRKEFKSDAPRGITMGAELAQLQKEKKTALADLEKARKARDRAARGWLQAKKRLAEKRAAVREARVEERAAATEKVAEAKRAAKRKHDERLAEELEKRVKRQAVEVSARLEQLKEQRDKARARARDHECREAESSRRLKRARRAEAAVKELKRKVAELEANDSDSDSDSDSESDDQPATAQRTRRDERGRFGAADWRLRPLQWAQLARRTPPTAINTNISDVLRVYAPGAFAPQPCEQQLRKMRGELTIAGECIAAYRVAACLRILSFGWDESNKWGLGLLSSNMQIIERGASEPVNLVPRGATLTAGGTAKQIAKEIEEKIFLHLRKLLIGWRSCHQARFGEGSWAAAGPDPECIGMHRLSERTMLQSDTCNAARATKALVAEMAEAASRDKHGISDADWEAMDATARATKSQARPCLPSAPTP